MSNPNLNLPSSSLMIELRQVEEDARALVNELAVKANQLPLDFPVERLKDIAVALQTLPNGSFAGARAPLEYANRRLVAIWRAFLTDDSQVHQKNLDDTPPLFRGSGVDRGLRDLIASVAIALYEWRRLANDGEQAKSEENLEIRSGANVGQEIEIDQETLQKLKDAFKAGVRLHGVVERVSPGRLIYVDIGEVSARTDKTTIALRPDHLLVNRGRIRERYKGEPFEELDLRKGKSVEVALESGDITKLLIITTVKSVFNWKGQAVWVLPISSVLILSFLGHLGNATAELNVALTKIVLWLKALFHW